LCSVVSSYFTYFFNKNYTPKVKQFSPAIFDCRCFNMPKEEVQNYFYWRFLDCRRNAINSIGQRFFSHKELQGKTQTNILEMLLDMDIKVTEKYSPCCLYGSWYNFSGEVYDINTKEDVFKIVNHYVGD
jgi:tRNA(His) 5'-end guanylyltransferase